MNFNYARELINYARELVNYARDLVNYACDLVNYARDLVNYACYYSSNARQLVFTHVFGQLTRVNWYSHVWFAN